MADADSTEGDVIDVVDAMGVVFVYMEEVVDMGARVIVSMFEREIPLHEIC